MCLGNWFSLIDIMSLSLFVSNDFLIGFDSCAGREIIIGISQSSSLVMIRKRLLISLSRLIK